MTCVGSRRCSRCCPRLWAVYAETGLWCCIMVRLLDRWRWRVRRYLLVRSTSKNCLSLHFFNCVDPSHRYHMLECCVILVLLWWYRWGVVWGSFFVFLYAYCVTWFLLRDLLDDLLDDLHAISWSIAVSGFVVYLHLGCYQIETGSLHRSCQNLGMLIDLWPLPTC